MRSEEGTRKMRRARAAVGGVSLRAIEAALQVW